MLDQSFSCILGKQESVKYAEKPIELTLTRVLINMQLSNVFHKMCLFEGPQPNCK